MKDTPVYTLPPGGGKTITTLQSLENGIVGHTLYFAPRHAMLEEQGSKFPGFVRVRARAYEDISKSAEEQLCIMPARCNTYASKRWNTVQSVCLSQCPKGFDCDYRWQFVPRNTLLTHDFLFSPLFLDWLCKGPGGHHPPHSWVIVIDEPSIGMFIEKVDITCAVLTKEIGHTDHEPIQTLLSIVREAIETACSDGGEPVKIVGQEAFERIVEVALRKDVSLSELVVEAREAANDDKLPRVRVGCETAFAISRHGTSVGFLIDNSEVWLPAKEIEFDEANRVIILPKWLAEKHKLTSVVDIEVADAKEIRLNFVTDLISCLEADLSKQRPFNSPLVITQSMLRLNLKRSIAHLKGPVVMLSAYAESDLLSALTERRVHTWSIPLKLAAENIIQVTDGQYGITTLWDKQEDTPKKALIRLVRAVEALVEGQEAEALIVTWKRIAGWLIAKQEHGELDSRISIAWYGAIEGLNAYEDKKQVFLIGTPTPPVDDIVEMAQAIWVDDPNPLNPEVRRVWRRYAYRAENGSGMEALVWEFADERLNMILKHHREKEIIQAAHRIRPLLHANRTIYLLTNLPIDELPPKQLTTLNQLTENDQSEVYEAFKVMVDKVLDTYSGVWSQLLEGEKCRKDMPVIYIPIYNRHVLATFLSDCNKRTIRRWLAKAASDLILEAKTLVFGRNVRVKVWHRPGQLDEMKIRTLWKNQNVLV